MSLQKKFFIQADLGVYNEEECTITLFVKPKDLIFKHQIIGCIEGNDGYFEPLKAYGDGYVTHLNYENGERIYHYQNEENKRELVDISDGRGCLNVMSYISLSEAIAQDLVDVEDMSLFQFTLVSPFNKKAYRNNRKIISFDSKTELLYYATQGLDFHNFKIVRWLIPDDNLGTYVRRNQPLVELMPKEWATRFDNKLKKEADEAKLKDDVEVLRGQKKTLEKEIESLQKLIKKDQAKQEQITDSITNATQKAKKVVDKAHTTAKEIITKANKAAENLIEIARTHGAQAATQVATKIKTEAGTQKNAILERVKQQEREALEAKKQAEDEASQIVSSAESKAQEIIAITHKDAADIKAAAHKEAKAIKDEATQQLQQIKDNAEKLELEAVTQRLYTLVEGGAKVALLERPQLRTLAFKLNQLVTDSQGVAAPETASLLNTQNKYDELEAMYDVLAQKINTINARDNWPDEVKERAIDALMSSAEVKTGALTDEDLTNE